MNTECVYILKEQTIESAHKFADKISKYGEDREIFPVAISRITFRTTMTPDYDNFGKRFTVKPGTLVVFVGGKLHNMMEIKPGGARRGFPCRWESRRVPNWFEDIELFD